MKTQGEWTVKRAKAGYYHEIKCEGAKVASVWEWSDAKRIVRDHNTHDQLVKAVQHLLEMVHDVKAVQHLLEMVHKCHDHDIVPCEDEWPAVDGQKALDAAKATR